MIVISLTDCPPKVRGDLSKWMCEINTGVYVGTVSARVRDELWLRITENLPRGRATMVYNAANEQRMEFRVHNTTWQPVDFDGLTLMRRPGPPGSGSASSPVLPAHFSKIAKREQLRHVRAAQQKNPAPAGYVVIDVETTGLSCREDDIIELAALRVQDGETSECFSALVKPNRILPAAITDLTGITPELLMEQGRALDVVLKEFLAFVGQSQVISHNAAFDYGFIRNACQRCELPAFSNRCVDTLPLARRKVADVADYKLMTLAKYFDFPIESAHRALQDCEMTRQLYEKLNEKQQNP